MARKPDIITSIRKYLIDENIYTQKDEITLMLLETTYSQYIIATKEVKEHGQTIEEIGYKGQKKTITNPSFKNQLDLQKQLFKLIQELYLTPKSRKNVKETNVKEDNPFINLINEIKEIK